MAWLRVDDTFFSNPKVGRAHHGNPESIGAWLMCASWSAHERTDGVIPEYLPSMWGISPDAIDVLVHVGLWHVSDGGWVIHDFLDYNPSRAELDEKRDKEAARRQQRAGTSTPRPRHERSTVAARTQHERDSVNGPVPVPVPDPVTSLREVKSGKSLSAKEARTRKRLGLDGPEGDTAA